MSGRSKAISSVQSLIKKNKNFKIIKQKMDDKTRLKRKEAVRGYIKYSVNRTRYYFHIRLTIALRQK